MKIIEYLKSPFVPRVKLPDGFVRNPEFDAVFAVDVLEYVPSVVRARDGHSYVYFEHMDMHRAEVIRAMGFKLELHISRKYKPAKIICRAPIGRRTHQQVLSIAERFLTIDQKDIETYKSNLMYKKYITAYGLKTM